MSLKVLSGPPGSGRTRRLLALAKKTCDAGGRVWWVGLPAQRGHTLRRLTADGYAALGFEFMSAQQLYYRLLTAATDLRPLVVGTARLVRVVEALHHVNRAFPTPGEARLFAAAIAEAKRYAVTPRDYEQLAADTEQRRFAAVYAAYQAGMTNAWDYDDARQAALDLVNRKALTVEADVVIVDGLREVGPLELRFWRGLARHINVHLSLAVLPPGLEPTTVLPARDSTVVERFAAANPVEEGRWVMRSVKQDLFGQGMAPLDVAIVAPAARARALVALAEEYGVPLMDETPLALADEGQGRVLVDLLELPEMPTPTRLLAVPALEELGRLALEAGVAGNAAVGELARRNGLSEVWLQWRERLKVTGDAVTWARELMAELLEGAPRELVERALGKAQEAARLGAGDGFRAWWAALLQDARQARAEGAGVALLDATSVSGRRYRKVYLVGAVEGAYRAGEREDYFLPEEMRNDLSESFAHLGLPRRFQGRGEAFAMELLQRADHLVITAPLGDQGGPLVLDEALFGATEPPALPLVPAGSRLELPGAAPYVPDLSPVALGRPYVESLRRYHDCSFRMWGEGVLRVSGDVQDEEGVGERLRAALLQERGGRLTVERLAALVEEFPNHAAWLNKHAQLLSRLTYGVELGGRAGFAITYLHATEKVELAGGGFRVDIYRFVPWSKAWDEESADDVIKNRWSEYWAVGALFAQPAFRVQEVHVLVWPIGEDPIDLAPRGGVSPRWLRVSEKRSLVEETLPAFMRGEVKPNPGFICRTCPVFDLCREGVR
ncbi:MAG TPA: hypothetical protein VFN07_00755 [Trueperaceae bacterium]|nr:hypothetical protein [Trueperaceae bacterium]